MAINLEQFELGTDQLLSAYNATYAPLYGTTHELRVSAAGRAYSNVQTAGPVLVRSVDLPTTGDFVVRLDLKVISSNLNIIWFRVCANASDQVCHECKLNTDTGTYRRTLDAAGSIVTSHGFTPNWNRASVEWVEWRRTGNNFTFAVKDGDGTRVSSAFTDASLANGIAVIGLSVQTSTPHLTLGSHIDQICARNTNEICPSIPAIASFTGSQVDLTWNAASGGVSAITYQLQRSLDIVTPSYSNIGSPVSGLSTSDSTVVSGTDYLYRLEITDGTTTQYSKPVAVTPVNISTFDADDAAVTWIGRYTDDATYRVQDLANGETWFRFYGTKLRIHYQSSGSAPIFLNIDGGTWDLMNGGQFIATTSGTVSGDLFDGGTDDWHDVRIRLNDGGYAGNFGICLVGGIIIEAAGTPAIQIHPDVGEVQYVDSVFGDTNWHHTFLLESGSSPFNYFHVPSGGVQSHTNSVLDFKVDASTTKIYFWTLYDSTSFAIWEQPTSSHPMVRRLIVEDPGVSGKGTYQIIGPYTLTGSGARTVRISNARAVHSVVIDGAFVADPVEKPTTKVVWLGDSVTEGTAQPGSDDASGKWDLLGTVVFGGYASYNCAKNGDSVAAAISASMVANDVAPVDPDYVMFWYGVNDYSRVSSDPAGLEADYVTIFNQLIAQTTAEIVVVPILGLRDLSVWDPLIQSAIATVGNSRLYWRAPIGGYWDCDLAVRDGDHPYSLGSAQVAGHDVAGVRVAAQPSDGDTVTLNGTVYEFDNDASITGDVSVTIGASVADTVTNLATAIVSRAGTDSYRLLGDLSTTGETARKGVVVSDVTSISTSGTNLSSHQNSDGWLDVLAETLSDPTVTSASVNVAGDTLTLTFNEAVTGQDGWTLRSQAAANIILTPTSGDGTTTHTFSFNRVIYSSELLYLDYDSVTGNATGFTGAVEITTFSDYGVTNNSTQIAPTLTVSTESVSAGTIEFTAIVSYVDGTDDNYTSIFSKDGSFVEFGASVPDLIDRISRDASVRSFLSAIGVSATIKPQNPDVNGVSWRFQVKSESGKTMAAWSETHVDDYYFLSEYGVGYWGFLATDGGVSALFDRLV